jgi:hypothetical protein
MKKTSSPSNIEKAFQEGTPIDNALKRAMRKAAILHKKLGNPVYGSRKGKLIKLPPEEISVPEETKN